MTDTPNPSTITLSDTLAAEKAAAIAVSDAYTAFKQVVQTALSTLPTAQAYNPAIRMLASGAISTLTMQLGTQLPALIASYDPPATVTNTTAS